MLYIASSQAATAQLGALKCDFYVSGVDTVVINKLTRLELYRVDPDGSLELIEEIPVWSGIAAIASEESLSSIVVLTTCSRLFVLAYQPHHVPKVQTVASISIAETFGRVSEYHTIQVDPLARCLAIHAYDGFVRIVPLTSSMSSQSARRTAPVKASKAKEDVQDKSQWDLSDSFNVRISNLNVTALAMQSTPLDSAPAFSIVYTDHTGTKKLSTYNIDLEDRDIEEGLIPTETLQDAGSELCIGLVEQAGVLVIGEESVTYFDVDGPAQDTKGKRKAQPGRRVVRCKLPLSRITAYAVLTREVLLLGDIFGKLFAINIHFRSSQVESLKATDLGDTTSPTAIVPLTTSLVYLASRFGDAQVVKLPEAFSTSNSSRSEHMDEDGTDEPELQLVTSYPNLAPIVDACIVGGDGGSAGYVVSCSGAYKSGSLRVVRRGVGFTEHANLEVEGVQRMWVITGNNEQILRVSYTEQDGEIEHDVEEVELAPFKADLPTILAARLGDVLVQVTATGVAVASITGGASSSWTPEGKQDITAASASGDMLLLALQGGQVVLLRSTAGQLTQQSSASFETDIASLAVSTTPLGCFAVVGLWTSQQVHLLSLPDLVTCATQTLATTYLIRSVLLTTFADGASVLFVGLGDGSLVTSTVDLETKQIDASSTKTVILGKRPFLLSEFAQNGKDANVFACSDRPAIISRSKGRLVYSTVNVEDIHAIVSIADTDHPTLALASVDRLQLGRIDAIDRIDIRTIPLDEDEPRRIAYDPELSTFAVLCAKRDVDRTSGSRSIESSIRFVAEATFATRSKIELRPNEEGQAITGLATDDANYFAVVVAQREEGVDEPEKGRLIIYRQVDSDTFEQAAEIDINGCPFAVIDAGSSSIALAANSQVLIYTFDPTKSLLSLAATWSGAFIALSLARGPDSTIIVGDALRSITVLRWSADARQPKLEEVAKDYRSRYMVGAESILPPSASGDQEAVREIVGAETDLNLFTVEYDPSSQSGRLEDAGTLAARGSFHLGEMVSRFRHGIFGQQYGDSSGVAQPRLIFTTSAGSVGIIADLDSDASILLSSLERNMRHCVEGVGNLSQEEFRSFRADKRSTPSRGFVDGSFVQQFLDLEITEQDRVMAGRTEFEKLDVDKNEIVRVLEEVGRLH
ncbi:uncharacterized protein JCM15063_004361 [Sporobolomyces koalae]|uniref:uncharacterized protein n=1 Tax=Sporobolomyces koalae TaxID=500713 RepID=UPI0031703EFD